MALRTLPETGNRWPSDEESVPPPQYRLSGWRCWKFTTAAIAACSVSSRRYQFVHQASRSVGQVGDLGHPGQAEVARLGQDRGIEVAGQVLAPGLATLGGGTDDGGRHGGDRLGLARHHFGGHLGMVPIPGVIHNSIVNRSNIATGTIRGGRSGFSARNLWRMKQFYETYRGQPKLDTAGDRIILDPQPAHHEPQPTRRGA